MIGPGSDKNWIHPKSLLVVANFVKNWISICCQSVILTSQKNFETFWQKCSENWWIWEVAKVIEGYINYLNIASTSMIVVIITDKWEQNHSLLITTEGTRTSKEQGHGAAFSFADYFLLSCSCVRPSLSCHRDNQRTSDGRTRGGEKDSHKRSRSTTKIEQSSWRWPRVSGRQSPGCQLLWKGKCHN